MDSKFKTISVTTVMFFGVLLFLIAFASGQTNRKNATAKNIKAGRIGTNKERALLKRGINYGHSQGPHYEHGDGHGLKGITVINAGNGRGSSGQRNHINHRNGWGWNGEGLNRGYRQGWSWIDPSLSYGHIHQYGNLFLHHGYVHGQGH